MCALYLIFDLTLTDYYSKQLATGFQQSISLTYRMFQFNHVCSNNQTSTSVVRF